MLSFLKYFFSWISFLVSYLLHWLLLPNLLCWFLLISVASQCTQRAWPSALVLTPLAISSSLIELNVISVVRIPCFICCCCLVTKLYLTLLWPQPARLLIHGISQARILEWVAISFSRGTLWPRDSTCVSCIGRKILYLWATWEAPKYYFSSILIGVPVFTLACFRVTLIQYKLHCVIFLLILSSGFKLQRGNRKN